MKITRIALLSLAACSGTDTGNPPVIDFGNSGCHDQSYDKGLHLSSLEARYKGLTCIAAAHDDGILHVQVSNYDSGCGSDRGWTPRAELRDDGGLDLILEDHDCAQASCGWCLYDLSFTLQLAQAPTGEVRLYQRGCDGSPQEKRAVFAQGADVACAYTNASALLWKGGDEGGERMVCGTYARDPNLPCQQGLTCTPAASDGERCLRTCTSDADCDSLERCDAKVCRLSATGLTSSSTADAQ